jgi:hypothetical protein
MVTGAATSNLDTFVQYVQIVGLCVQILFYLLLPLAAWFAAWQLKRFTDFKIGVAVADEPAADKKDKGVKVEEFVE